MVLGFEIPFLRQKASFFQGQTTVADDRLRPAARALSSSIIPIQMPTNTNSSLQTLPLEIRWQIYSHLLLSENVLETTSTTDLKELHPRFTTPLFRVSKKISAETLEFFYNENTFLSFETNMKRFFSLCRETIPMIRYYNHGGIKLPGFACSIRYTRAGLGSWPSTSKCILAASDLPQLVSLINMENRFTVFWAAEEGLSLSLNFSRDYSGSGINAMHRATDSFCGLRNVYNFSQKMVKLEIQGHISDEERSSIEAALTRPALTYVKLVDVAIQARQRGQLLIETGRYAAARGENNFCSHLIERMQKRPSFRGLDELSKKLKSLEVDACLDMSLVESSEGFFEDAVRIAEHAWDIGSPYAGQLAELKFGLGAALASAGRYEDAIGALSHARDFDQENETIGAMLESLKFQLNEQKRACTYPEDSEREKSLRGWFKVVMVERRRRLCSDGIIRES